MREFTKISPQLWDCDGFRGQDDTARLAYLYLLSNSHQNSVGCYRLPAAYASADLEWPPQKWERALEALIGAGLVKYDMETREVFISDWFQHNPPTNAKHHLGCERLIDKIKSSTFREKTKGDLETVPKKWNSYGPQSTGLGKHLWETPRMRSALGQ